MVIEALLLAIVLLLLFLIYKTVFQKQMAGLPTEVYGQLMSEIGKLQKTIDERTSQQVESQRRYQERVERSLSGFMSVITGTKRRGAAGEAILKEILAEPIRVGLIVTDLKVDGKTVEFAWDVGYGKYIPIDSKLPEVDELYRKYSSSDDTAEQRKLKSEIVKRIRYRVDEVKMYRNRPNTIDKCILALPDGLMEVVPELSAEINRSGVVVSGYSQVFFFGYFLAANYRRTVEAGDMGQYQRAIEGLTSLMVEVANRTTTIDRAITMIENANREIKESIAQSGRYRVGEVK